MFEGLSELKGLLEMLPPKVRNKLAPVFACLLMAVLFLSAINASGMLGATDHATVRGVVRSMNGEPLRDVTVILESVSNTQQTTDDMGVFSFRVSRDDIKNRELVVAVAVNGEHFRRRFEYHNDIGVQVEIVVRPRRIMQEGDRNGHRIPEGS